MTQWELSLADSIGVSVSILRYAISFFASVAAGAGFRHVPTVRGRHVYALVTGFLLVYYPFGNGVVHLIVPSVLTYLIMLRIREYAATLAWLLNFGYLIGCHVLLGSGDAWKKGTVDYTGAMMVLTLKLVTSAVTYQDGLKKTEELKPYQQVHKLTRMPSPLEWFSYLFACGNLLSGPHFELSTYLDYIDRRGAWDPAAQRPIPSPRRAGALRLAKAVACLLVYYAGLPYLGPSALESAWFANLSFPLRLGVIWLVGVEARFKYYFAWCVSEAGLIFSLFCFNGYDERGIPRWDRYQNTNILKVEFATSAAELPAHWNTRTGNFLRQYIYERLTPRGRKPTFRTMLMTQVVAAVWHGLFPGYALFFVSSAFMFESAKIIYRYEQGLPGRWQWVRGFAPWQIVKFLYTGIVLNYCASAFLLLDLHSSIQTWRSVHFLGHFLMLSIFLVSYVNPPRRPRKQAPTAPVIVDGAVGAKGGAGAGDEVGTHPPAIAETVGNGELAHAVEAEEAGPGAHVDVGLKTE